MTGNLPFNNPPNDRRPTQPNENVQNLLAGLLVLGVVIGVGTIIGRALK